MTVMVTGCLYAPQLALSAIIISAMLGLVEYEKYYHLFKTDKFDFLISMSAFLGVPFISMDIVISVGLSLVRALLYIARPTTCKLVNIPESNLYRDIEQYPNGSTVPGVLVLQLGSPLYFANANYMKERIMRWVQEEFDLTKSSQNDIEYILIDFGGVTSIDHARVEALVEVRRSLEAKGNKMILINPRLDVMEKLIVAHFIDKIGKDSIGFLID